MGTSQSTVREPMGVLPNFHNPIKVADRPSKRQRRTRNRVRGKLSIFPNKKAWTRALASPSQHTDMTVPETPLLGGDYEMQTRPRFTFESSSMLDSDMKENQNESSGNDALDEDTLQDIVMGQVPLVAPPKGRHLLSSKSKSSVDPQTIASFNRLKIQVQLAEKEESLRRRKAKLEDRIEDVKGYRNLWKEYEEIQQRVHCQQQFKEDSCHGQSKTEMNMDLTEPTSWYFDFHALSIQEYFEGDDFKFPGVDVETRSQTSLSMLSEISLDAQRKYYGLKSRKRRIGFEQNTSEYGSQKDQNQNNTDSDRSFLSTSTGISSRRAVYLRGKTNNDPSDYGPVQMRGLRKNLREDPSVQFSINNTIHETKALVNTGVKMNGAIREESISSSMELDLDNDYGVSRHRSSQYFNKDGTLFHTNNSAKNALESNVNFGRTSRPQNLLGGSDTGVRTLRSLSSDVEGPISKVGAVRSIPTPPKSKSANDGFDPSTRLSSQLELYSQTIPSVQIDDAETGVVRWRKFSPTGNNSKTSRRLDDLFAGGKRKDIEASSAEFADAQITTVERNVDSTYKESKEESLSQAKGHLKYRETARQIHSFAAERPYDMMSPGQFLMMSSFHTPSDHHDKQNLIQNEEKSFSTTEVGETVASEDRKSAKKQNEMSSSAVTMSKKKSYDSAISTMSTEDFLRMSSWVNGVAHLDPVPIESPKRSPQKNEDLKERDQSEKSSQFIEARRKFDRDPLAQIFLNAPDDHQQAKGAPDDSQSQSSESGKERLKSDKKQLSSSGKGRGKRTRRRSERNDDPLTQIFLNAPGDDQLPSNILKNAVPFADNSAEVSEAVNTLLSKYRADSEAVGSITF